jgi:hypothetical protein
MNFTLGPRMNSALGTNNTVGRRLALRPAATTDWNMSNKELVSDLLARLPDDVSLQQIARELEFIAGVREGLAQLDRGEGIAIEEVDRLIESWTTR